MKSFSTFGFVLVCLWSKQSERSWCENAEESYTAILPKFIISIQLNILDFKDASHIHSKPKITFSDKCLDTS